VAAGRSNPGRRLRRPDHRQRRPHLPLRRRVGDPGRPERSPGRWPLRREGVLEVARQQGLPSTNDKSLTADRAAGASC
jgi:hypothetical protein